MVVGFFAVDTVLLAENVVKLQRIVDEFDKVCKMRKLRVAEFGPMLKVRGLEVTGGGPV